MQYPQATQRPVPSHGGHMTSHLGLILHVQAGDNSPYGWFGNPRNQASSTWWVSKTGVVEQYVDSDTVAWAQAAGNLSYNSVETEGQPDQALTDAQLDSLARLYAWGAGAYNWPVLLAESPGQKGLGWHGMGGHAWGGHTGCPGDIRKNQRINILARVSKLLEPNAPQLSITTTDFGDVSVKATNFANVKLDDAGNGWLACDADDSTIVSIEQQGSYPPDDGYWPICKFGHQARDIDGHKSVIEIQGGNPGQVISFYVWTT